MIKKLKKLLYLLQLEEYQNDRFYDWLKNHQIESLEERKSKLKWTARAILTCSLSLPLLPIFGSNMAIRIINSLLEKIFKFSGVIIVLSAKTKLLFYRKLIRVVVTGSYGKTTFKETLAWVLEEKFSVLKTLGNVNHRIGIARMILTKLNKNHQILITEAAAYKPGEIKAICELVKPDFGIITSIGWMHLERFKAIKNIEKTKKEITPFIKNSNQLVMPTKLHQMINFEKTCLKIGLQLGMDSKSIRERLKIFKPPERRLTVKKINPQVTLIDDSYNSNPLGFRRALEKLSSFSNYQKVLVTRGMIELGPKQYILNKQAAKEAKKVADLMVIVGKVNRKAFVDGFGEENLLVLESDENLDEKLSAFLKPPTVILLESQLPDHYF